MKTIRLFILLAVVLFINIANAQTIEIDKAKARIAELFKTVTYISIDKDNRTVEETRTFVAWGTPKDVFVLDDKIEFRRKKENAIIYYYADLANVNITITNDQKNNVSVIFENFLINFKRNENGNLLVDNLNIIRNYYNEELYNSQLVLFEPIAASYRSLTVKPPISEQQRERIVQANLFSQQGQYAKAIEFYTKAIEIDPTAYPAGYYNLALLSAQVTRFNAAVYYMKKYLMLEPEAEDARGAKDKIYEWQVQKNK
jgi:tetratricopeptide (TPR) repeat protein